MKFLRFANGDLMPALGLGTWKSAPGEVYDAVRTAIKIGYRHFDCAAIYGNEVEIGEAISDAICEGEVERKDLWITSKLWNSNHKKEDVLEGFGKTLSDLKLEYLDLYLMHWPLALKKGVGFPSSPDEFVSLAEAPLHETWAEMEKIKMAGKTRHLGVSNFNTHTLEGLMTNAQILPEMNQIEMHPYLPQHKLVDYCQSKGLHLTAYSPLGSGDRPAGRILLNEPKLLTDPTILEMAESNNITAGQVLLAWQVNRGVAVIPKSTNEGRLMENLNAADIVLSADEMAEINQIEIKYRYINGALWLMVGSGYAQADLWEL